jgi:hypothetical protein
MGFKQGKRPVLVRVAARAEGIPYTVLQKRLAGRVDVFRHCQKESVEH